MSTTLLPVVQPIVDRTDGPHGILLTLTGAADLGGLPEVERALRHVVAEGSGATVTIDIDGLTVVHDAVIGMIAGAAADLSASGGTVTVICRRRATAERFETLGLHRVLGKSS